MTAEFDELFSIGSIEAEYLALLRSRHDFLRNRPRILPGSDRIDIDLFHRNRMRSFSAIHRKIMGSKSNNTPCRYTFSAFLEREVPKPESTKIRTISISTISDTIVQRLLQKHIEPAVESRLCQSAYGFRKRRTAHHAVYKVREHLNGGLNFVFEADIQEFFDKIDRKSLVVMVNDLEIDIRAKHLIYRFLHSDRVLPVHVAEDRNRAGRTVAYTITKRSSGVPQGGVLSGMLTNLYLSKFDKILSAYMGYVRYADDFVVCCSSPEQVEEVRSLVTKSLAELKLALHPTKTSQPTQMESRSVEFLGFEIAREKLSVRKKNISRFKKRISLVISSHKGCDHNVFKLNRLLRRLRYKVCGPTNEELDRTSFGDRPILKYRRCWIGFFRIVSDIQQMKQLDRWICASVSKYAWMKLGMRIKRADIRKRGLPSLVNILFRSRKINKQETKLQCSILSRYPFSS